MAIIYKFQFDAITDYTLCFSMSNAKSFNMRAREMFGYHVCFD